MAAVTITFGDCAENHAGMQKLGAAAASGLTYRELVAAKVFLEETGSRCELVDLISRARVEDAFDGKGPEPAEVLIVRQGANRLLQDGLTADDLLAEHDALVPDTKALMRGRVVNKIARHNLCFADEAQEPDYESGKGRVVAFPDVPLTEGVRKALPGIFGPKTASLYAEGNYYYDLAKCGIGFHGDSERRIVVAVRLGEPFPLHYQWFYRNRPIGDRVVLALNHGDVYLMSEKAVGYDWKRPSIPTLRHAAGAAKYLRI